MESDISQARAQTLHRGVVTAARSLTAKNGAIIDTEGQEFIDFAGTIGGTFAGNPLASEATLAVFAAMQRRYP